MFRITMLSKKKWRKIYFMQHETFCNVILYYLCALKKKKKLKSHMTAFPEFIHVRKKAKLYICQNICSIVKSLNVYYYYLEAFCCIIFCMRNISNCYFFVISNLWTPQNKKFLERTSNWQYQWSDIFAWTTSYFVHRNWLNFFTFIH